jgi:hypothetical protein
MIQAQLYIPIIDQHLLLVFTDVTPELLTNQNQAFKTEQKNHLHNNEGPALLLLIKHKYRHQEGHTRSGTSSLMLLQK